MSRGGDCGQESKGAQMCVFLSSAVLEGELCFRMEAEESEIRLGRRLGANFIRP